MPLCDLYLLALSRSNASVPSFLQSLRHNDIRPITQSRVLRWIILPTELSTAPLLAHNVHWDLLLILPADTPLPSSAASQISAQWTATIGVPSRLLADYARKNEQLLNPPAGTVKPPDRTGSLTATSSQSLELSDELQSWISAQAGATRAHAVSMLNLLAFRPGRKDDYLTYGRAFGDRIGARHGGDAKIVGSVVRGSAAADGWDEVALAHYPSLDHFAAMLASQDYQEVNRKYRVPSLRDTFILCTVEIDSFGELAGKSSDGGQHKL